MTKRTKMNKLPKMRYFKIPLCLNFDVKRLKCPLGVRTTQTNSNADKKMILMRSWINDLYRQAGKTQRQMQGLKMGSIAGNDQNTLLCNFMKKVLNKRREKFAKRNLEAETVAYVIEAQSTTQYTEKYQKKKFRRVFLGPK